MVRVQRKEDRLAASGAVMLANDSSFISGLVSNMSSTGLCAYVQGHFVEGEDVSVYSSSFNTRGPRQGAVRWCEQLSDDLYVVGLRFNHPE